MTYENKRKEIMNRLRQPINSPISDLVKAVAKIVEKYPFVPVSLIGLYLKLPSDEIFKLTEQMFPKTQDPYDFEIVIDDPYDFVITIEDPFFDKKPYDNKNVISMKDFKNKKRNKKI